jgi:hypothetical protein
VLQSALQSCHVNKPEDATTKCKLDKEALEREDLEKSTAATAEPVELAESSTQTPLWA